MSTINKINAIILDDEPNAIENLQLILGKYCPEINIVKTATTIPDAYKSINELKPQLVFLDIDIGKNQTSFDLLKLYNPVPFKIIFVTAFHDFAIKAIKYAALDYVLKPIDENELIQAIEKLKKETGSTTNVDLLQQQIQNNKLADKIALNLGSSTELVSLDNIISIESDKSYTWVSLISGEKLLVSKSIGEFEALLEQKGFYRIHKSYIVNIAQIKSYSTNEGGIVIMSNKASLPIADRKKQAFFKKIDDLLK